MNHRVKTLRPSENTTKRNEVVDFPCAKDVELDGGGGGGGGGGGDDGDWTLYPKSNNLQNFCYLCVDPWKRHVTVWYHGYRAYW